MEAECGLAWKSETLIGHILRASSTFSFYEDYQVLRGRGKIIVKHAQIFLYSKDLCFTGKYFTRFTRAYFWIFIPGGSRECPHSSLFQPLLTPLSQRAVGGGNTNNIFNRGWDSKKINEEYCSQIKEHDASDINFGVKKKRVKSLTLRHKPTETLRANQRIREYSDPHALLPHHKAPV